MLLEIVFIFLYFFLLMDKRKNDQIKKQKKEDPSGAKILLPFTLLGEMIKNLLLKRRELLDFLPSAKTSAHPCITPFTFHFSSLASLSLSVSPPHPPRFKALPPNSQHLKNP